MIYHNYYKEVKCLKVYFKNFKIDDFQANIQINGA